MLTIRHFIQGRRGARLQQPGPGLNLSRNHLAENPHLAFKALPGYDKLITDNFPGCYREVERWECFPLPGSPEAVAAPTSSKSPGSMSNWWSTSHSRLHRYKQHCFCLDLLAEQSFQSWQFCSPLCPRPTSVLSRNPPQVCSPAVPRSCRVRRESHAEC